MFRIISCCSWPLAVTLVSREPQADPRMKHAFRRAAEERLDPTCIWKARPPRSAISTGTCSLRRSRTPKVIATELTHDTKRTGTSSATQRSRMLWPHIEQEYRDELQGIADGLKARRVQAGRLGRGRAECLAGMDPYYIKWYEQEDTSCRRPATLTAPSTAARSSPPAAIRKTAASLWATTTGPAT